MSMSKNEKYARDYYIKDHGITQETLDSLGIVFRTNGVVVLPYEGRLRERIDLPIARPDGKRFVWGKSDVPITPFNYADAVKPVVFVTEGESDAMRLWQDIHAEGKTETAGVVGLPGVEAWKDEWAERFETAERIYIVLDNPSGYDDPEQIERAWRKMRGALGDRCRRVPLRDDCKDLTEFLEKYGYKAFKHKVKNESTAGKQHWMPLNLLVPPEPPDWLLHDVLARGQTNVMIGEAWGGKSFWYMGLIRAMLKGERSYCGLALNVDKDARILVFDEENPPKVPIWRLNKLGVSEDFLNSGRLRIINRAGVLLDKNGTEIMDEALHQAADLIVFDSFDRMHNLENPNQSGPVSELFKGTLMPLAVATNAAILILHHENKPPPPPKNGAPVFRSFSQRSRGSGAIGESADHGLILEVDADDHQTKYLKLGGSRSSERNPGDILTTFRIVDVPLDGGGKRVEIQQAGGPVAEKWEDDPDTDEDNDDEF